MLSKGVDSLQRNGAAVGTGDLDEIAGAGEQLVAASDLTDPPRCSEPAGAIPRDCWLRARYRARRPARVGTPESRHEATEQPVTTRRVAVERGHVDPFRI